MIMNDAPIEISEKTTKARLLDAAEYLYTQAGHEHLSLRELTERAHVNLAAVNYHFGSKNALVCAMVARRFDPINDGVIADLARLERTLKGQLRSEHLFGILAKGLSRPGFDIFDSSAHCDFAIRASADLSQPVRQFLSQRYAHVEKRFIQAFCQASPALSADAVKCRVNCLVFALSGTAINLNTIQLLRCAVFEQSMTKMQALAYAAAPMAALLHSPPLPDTNHLAMIETVFDDSHAFAA
jgi:AcrR family transcriptional regulator